LPAEKLTDARVSALEIGDQARAQVDYWDRIVPGLVLRVSSGRKTWCVVYRLAGRKDRLTFGSYPVIKLFDARERARKVLRDAQLGIDPKARTAPTSTLPFGEVIRQFRAKMFSNLAASTQKEWGRLLDVEITPALADMDPSDVKAARRRIREATDAIAERSGYTANRVWEIVRRILGWGISRDLIDPVGSATFANFERPAEEEKRTRVLSREEMRKVWTALGGEPPVTAIFWKLSFYTGQRRGEVLAARWDALDLERGLWTFRTKGDKPHVLGLPVQAVGILRQAWVLSSHTPFVCSGPAMCGHLYNPQKAATRMRARSGLQFRIHDIRRTVASGLGELGVDEGLISRILNHSTTSSPGATVTATVYNQFKYVEPMRKALQAWADRVDEVVGSKSGVVEILPGKGRHQQR
jgi:integrase